MPHDKTLDLILLLLLAGRDAIVNFLSFMMIHLARHPGLVADLRTDNRTLVCSAEEMFGHFSVICVARVIAMDQEYIKSAVEAQRHHPAAYRSPRPRWSPPRANGGDCDTR